MCIYYFSLVFAVAAAGGGGDVGVRESGARHERSAESRSVWRIQQDRHHRTVRRLHFLFTETDRLCYAGSPHILHTHCSCSESNHLASSLNKLIKSLPFYLEAKLLSKTGCFKYLNNFDQYLAIFWWGQSAYYEEQILFHTKYASQNFSAAQLLCLAFLLATGKQNCGPLVSSQPNHSLFFQFKWKSVMTDLWFALCLSCLHARHSFCNRK